MNFLKKISTGELIAFYSATLSTDKSSFGWTFNAEIADAASLDKLNPTRSERTAFIEIEFKLGMTVWRLITDIPNYGNTNHQFSLSARSKTVLLTEEFSEPMTKTWINSTPALIIAELCSAVGLAYSFDRLDSWSWRIDSFTVTERYPLDIIKELIAEKKGIAQTLPDGTVFITHNLPCSPKHINDNYDYYIATDKNLFERGNTLVKNKKYNSVLVTKDTNSLSDNAPSITVEEEQDGADALLKVVVSPFCNVELTHASANNINVFYEGVHYRTVTDQIVLDNGKAQLSKPFSELVSVSWHQNTLGELTINGKGEVSVASGFSVATIVYKSPCHQYRIQRLQDIDATGIKIQNTDVPINTGALTAIYGMDAANKPAPSVVVKMLETQTDLIERAQQELWEQVYDMDEYSINAAYENNPIMPATVCQVKINSENLVFNSYVKSVSISINSTITQQITVQRPLP